MALTPAQRSYLEVAAIRLLRFIEIKSSASIRCANTLAALGFLRRHNGEFRITRTGHAVLKDTTNAE